jgi:hypothetical protein
MEGAMFRDVTPRSPSKFTAGVTSQIIPFFIPNAMRTSNLTKLNMKLNYIYPTQGYKVILQYLKLNLKSTGEEQTAK